MLLPASAVRQDFHFGPGASPVYTRATPKTPLVREAGDSLDEREPPKIIVVAPDPVRVAELERKMNGGRGHKLRLLRVSDREVKTIASSRLWAWPQFSPDGKEIAHADGNCLMVASVRGGEAREITCAPPSKLFEVSTGVQSIVGHLWWSDLSAGWSSDGRMLAWTAPIPEKKQV